MFADEGDGMRCLNSLEHQHAAALWLYIQFLLHIQRMKSRRAALKSFPPILARSSIIKIKVQRKVRTLLAIGSFIGAVAMCCESC
jgi:hypothetical protein